MENIDKKLNVCTKMGADNLAENTPKCPKIYLPKLSSQAQKFGISMKKASLGVRSPLYKVKIRVQ